MNFSTDTAIAPPPSHSASAGNGRKLLVVDDSVLILTTLSRKLTASGYAVTTAQDGATAVSMIRQKKPDLILLDISFPPDTNLGGVSWDGFQVMDWLKRIGEAKGIPILIITGGDPLTCKDRAMKAGATHFFHKPIDNEELLSVIHQVLESNAPSAN
jgi:CheY-like chemotaxis protein